MANSMQEYYSEQAKKREEAEKRSFANSIHFTCRERMTIKELYEWAKEKGVEDLPIACQYQDDGGTYYGDTLDDGICGKVSTSGEEKYLILA